MSLENTEYWNHIIRYFSDSLSENEEQELFKWLETHPNYKESFNQIKVIWEASKTRQKEVEFDVEEIWQSLKPQLQDQPLKIKSIMANNTNWLKIAAAILIIVGIGFLMKNGLSNSEAIMVKVITPADSTISFYLPDSTHITLNENSTFTYPEAFAENHREITLIGEAYFDVKRDPKKPFTAYAGNSKTTVLGTSFNIKAREEDDDVEVEVFEGEVELSDADDDSEHKKKHIKKHEKGTYNKSKKSTSKKKSSGKAPKWVKKITHSKPVKTLTKEFKRAFNDVKKEL